MRPTPAGKCVFLAGSLSSCHDGVRSSQEEGVDCGGVCDTPCPVLGLSNDSGFWWQHRVAVLAAAGGVGFIALGVAGLLVHRVHSRRRALAAAVEGEERHARGGKAPGSRPVPRTRSVTAMKTKAVQVRPWARENSSPHTWLDKATPVSPSQPASVPAVACDEDDGVGASGSGARSEAGVKTHQATPALGSRGRAVHYKDLGPRVGIFASGRTTASVRSSAVKPDIF